MDRKSFILIIVFTISIFFIHMWFDKQAPAAPLKQQSSSTAVQPASETQSTSGITDEIFYVLENEYQQVVFSNIGGAITEINLPFKSQAHPQSVVLPIETDTILKKTSPTNARFPLNNYLIAGQPSVQTPSSGGYLPLLRRSIKPQAYVAPFITPSKYYAFNTLSQENDSAKYTVKRFEKDLIVFERVEGNRKITKTYRFAKNQNSMIPYSLTLDLNIDGDARGLSITSGVPEVEIISGSAPSDIKYRTTRNTKSTVEKIKLPKNSSSTEGSHIDWICNSNGFFGIIVDGGVNSFTSFQTTFVPGVKDPTRLSIVDAEYDRYPSSKYPGYTVSIPLAANTKSKTLRIFAGPLDQGVLQQVDQAFQAGGSNPNFTSAQSFHGWFAFISAPFAKFLFSFMTFFYSFTHSWGFSIILLTLLLKIMVYPLNNWSMRSTIKMQLIAPEAEALKKRFKDSKQMNLELMQLYRDRGVNPVSAFLPMIIQIPFLIGMFDLLKSSFPLRGASFIPGWIDNLTAPDALFSWSYPIPFLGTEFHFLPIILGGLMFFQQKFMTKMKTPSVTTQPSFLTSNLPTIIFTVLFYNFPSGLNLYWIASTVFGILQQILLTSQITKNSVKKTVKG